MAADRPISEHEGALFDAVRVLGTVVLDLGADAGVLRQRLTAARDAAEALKGTKLWVARERLPRTDEDEFLYSDLIGMAVLGTDGQTLGTVTAVHDFGAGDVLDIALSPKGNLMVPFTRDAVPEIDVSGRSLVVIPPVYAPDEKEEGNSLGRDG